MDSAWWDIGGQRGAEGVDVNIRMARESNVAMTGCCAWRNGNNIQ